MAIGAVIGGVLGAGSSIGATAWQQDTARKTSHETMDFQREMSNSAYTRAVADMKNAGLNPMLAYSQGGASTPSGSPQQVPQAPNIVSSAVAGSQAGAALNNLQADTRMKEAQSRNSNASAQATQVQTLDMMNEIQQGIRSDTLSKSSRAAQDWMDQAERRIKFSGRGDDSPDADAPIVDRQRDREGGPLPNVFDRVRREWAQQLAEKNFSQSRATGESLGLSEKRADEAFWRSNDLGKWIKELGPSAASALQILLRIMKR